MFKKSLLLLLLIPFAFSCSDPFEDANNANIVDTDKGQDNIFDYVNSIMHDEYLWSEMSPSVSNPQRYSTPEALLEALRYRDDRFSFISEEFNSSNARISEENNFEIEVGSGLIIIATPNYDAFYIMNATEGTPAYNAGVRRGDQILTINGNPIDRQNYGILYSQTQGTPIQLTVKRGTQDLNFSFNIARINADFVGPVTVFDDGQGHKTGYINFESFKTVAEEPLKAAFRRFEAEGVNNLILDLRFNGGGLVSLSAKLAAMIYPQATSSDVFLKQTYNDKYANENRNTLFNPQNINNNFQKVAIIQDAYTASASETIIFCLRPYLGNKLLSFGTESVGKDVGSVLFNKFGYNFFPIVFRITNKDNEGDYAQGLAPDIEIGESVFNLQNFPLGTRNEAKISAALNWIENGQVSNLRTKASEQLILGKYPYTTNLIDQ
ncbi:S41 family peptidase [Persicobacter psychrovividus]|uniref:PDZ domain-containing protein n=1 Tax=Persicobacter psychrovividus TaxID=387638 RepID=A0ABM7VKK0_9BACT|nr:hypothetical protein PEPS_37750 [Persicobacter psychrovividus]